MTAYPLPSIQNYENFDLLIDPTADGYQARVINSPVGQAITQFNLDVKISDQSDLKQVGALLYQTVFSGNVGICLRRSLDAVAQQPNSGLRIRLWLTNVPELATLPWETLYDAERNLFFALSAQTPLVRYQELDQGELPLQAALPLRLLVLISDPVDFWPRLDVEHEWQQLHDALADHVARRKVQLERLPARLGLLQQQMQQNPPHLLHFIGHGWYEDADHNGLVMEMASGQVDHVAVERFTALLHDHPTLRLVFLNTCEGARGDHTNAFAGVAQRLVQQGIPAVIAMQKEVSDQSAIALTQIFYQALAAGYPVDAALAEARKAIFANDNNQEWSTPALFSRAVDNRLFDLLDVLPPPPCPYPGMVPFTKNDARFFFGREDEIVELRHRLRHHNQLFVIGPSGAGKSSLVFAGLLPALEKQSTTPWRIHTFRPGATPLAALDEALADRPVVTEATTTASGDDQKFLLVIDQLEELFVQASKADQTTFIARVKALHQEQLAKLLITMRADFYPDLMNSDLWPIDVSQRLEIAPLRGEKLRQAIEQPADNVGVQLEAGLLEWLLADAADEPGVLPLLQETMVLLWDEQERRILPLAAYTRLGRGGRSGLAVAMATKADATLASLSPEQQHIARRVFLRLVQFGEGRSDTRRQQFLSDLASMSDDDTLLATTLRVLTDNRLVTMDGESDAANPKVDIAHEMLITHWPTAQDWITHRREAELTRRRLEEKTSEWVRLGRSDSGLLDAVELTEADRWVQSTDAIDLGYSKQLAMLVQHSRNILEQAAKEREAVRNRELAQTQAVKQKNAQLRRRAWLLSIVGAIAFVAAVGAGLFGVRTNRLADELDGKVQEVSTQATAVALERDQKVAAQKTALWNERVALTREADAKTSQTAAEQQALIARSRQLAAQSTSELSQNHYDIAILLAIESGRVADTLESFAAIRAAIASSTHSRTVLYKNISWATWSKDGHKILTIGSQIVRIWDVTNGRELVTFVGHTGSINQATWSKDEQMILTASADGTARIWDVTNGREMVKFVILEGSILQATWSQDEHKILTRSNDSTVRVWDAVNGQELVTFTKHTHYIYQAVWSRDEHRVLTSSADGTARIWDSATGRELVAFLGHTGIVSQATWNRDENRVLTAGCDQSIGDTCIQASVRIWDVTSGKELLKLSAHTGFIYQARWNNDEKHVLTSGCDNPSGKTCSEGSARIWDATSGKELVKLTGHKGSVTRAIWSADQQKILTSSADGTARIWDATNGKELATFLGHTGYDNQALWANDERKVLTIDVRGNILIWDAINGQELARLISTFNGATQAVWNVDEDKILTVGWDGTAQIWDTAVGHELITFTGHTDNIFQTTWSKDEQKILTASDDGTARIWDVKSGKELTRLPVNISNQLLWSKDEQTILTAGPDDVARIWDVTTRRELVKFVGHRAKVYSAQWNRKEDKILTTSSDGTARVWDAASGKDLITLVGHTEIVNQARWSKDEQKILTASGDGTAGIWDAISGQELITFIGHGGSVYQATWSPDENKILTYSTDGTARVWNTANGQELLRFKDKVGDIDSALWNVDGSKILTASKRGNTYIWDASSGKELARFAGYMVGWSKDEQWILTISNTTRIWNTANSQELIKLAGSTGNVRQGMWSADGHRILTNGNGIQIWDTLNGQELVRFVGVARMWSADGRRVLVTDRNSVSILYVEMSDLLTAACTWTPRNMMWTEWHQYMDKPYRPTCSNAPLPPDVIDAIKNEANALIQSEQVVGAIQSLQQLNDWLQLNGQFKNFGVDPQMFVAEASTTSGEKVPPVP